MGDEQRPSRYHIIDDFLVIRDDTRGKQGDSKGSSNPKDEAGHPRRIGKDAHL